MTYFHKYAIIIVKIRDKTTPKKIGWHSKERYIMKNIFKQAMREQLEKTGVWADWDNSEIIKGEFEATKVFSDKKEMLYNEKWLECCIQAKDELVEEMQLLTFKIAKKGQVDMFIAKSKDDYMKYALESFINDDGEGYTEQEIDDMTAGY